MRCADWRKGVGGAARLRAETPAADGLSAGGAAADHRHVRDCLCGGAGRNSQGRGALIASHGAIPAQRAFLASEQLPGQAQHHRLRHGGDPAHPQLPQGGRGGGQKPAIRADEPPDQRGGQPARLYERGNRDRYRHAHQQAALFDHERIALCAHRGRQRKVCVLGRAVSVGRSLPRSVAEPAGPDRGAGRPPYSGLCQCEAPGLHRHQL